MFDPQSGKNLVYRMIENAGSMNVSFTFNGRVTSGRLGAIVCDRPHWSSEDIRPHTSAEIIYLAPKCLTNRIW
jgi:hypothetical protein